jgi:hypothetical protein
MTAYQSTNSHNKTFSNDYKKYKLKEQEKKRLSDDVFSDLLGRYREKKYPISGLNLNKNLFEPSVLLMDEHEVKNRFKIHRDESEQLNKESKYLQSIESQVNEVTGEVASTKRMRIKKSNRQSKSMLITKTNKELKREIKTNEADIHRLKDTLRDMNFKAIVSRSTLPTKSMVYHRPIVGLSDKLKEAGNLKSAFLDYNKATIMKGLENSKSMSSTPHRRSTIRIGTKKKSNKSIIDLTARHTKNQNSNMTNLTLATTVCDTQGSEVTEGSSKKRVRFYDSRQDMLQSLYSRLSSRDRIDDDAKDQITNYLKTYTTYLNNKKTVKFRPNELLKTFTDIKSKIFKLDVHERYTMLGDRYSKLSANINTGNLNLVKELDKQIINSEVELIKALNQVK